MFIYLVFTSSVYCAGLLNVTLYASPVWANWTRLSITQVYFTDEPVATAVVNICRQRDRKSPGINIVNELSIEIIIKTNHFSYRNDYV